MKVLQVGQMMTFAEGEYSDYMVNGLVKVLTPFDLDEVKTEWERKHTGVSEHNVFKHRGERRLKPNGVDFLPWLVSKGLVEDVDYIEVHTGSYGECDITYD